jgi:hypothetical protein
MEDFQITTIITGVSINNALLLHVPGLTSWSVLSDVEWGAKICTLGGADGHWRRGDWVRLSDGTRKTTDKVIVGVRYANTWLLCHCAYVECTA